MNLRRLKKKLILFPVGKVCVALLLVYTFLCGSNLNYAISMDMSVSEYILYALTDHYYMIYAWLFFLIFFSVRCIREKSLIERMRFHTLREFYFLERLTKTIQIAGVIVIHSIIPFAISFTKLKCNNEFTIVLSEQMRNPNLYILTAYAKCFKTPLHAIFCVLAYWTVGSIFISEVIYYCSEIWKKKGMLICITFVLISIMTGFMTDMDDRIFEFLFLNNYFILHHVLLNIGMISVAGNLLIMLTGIRILEKAAIFKCCNKFTKTNSAFHFLFAVRPTVYLLFFIFLALLGIMSGETDPYSVTWGMVKGFSYKEFQLTEFLYYIAPALFILFFVNAAWEKEANSRSELAMFRIGNRRKWNQIIETSCMNFITKNCIAYAGIILLVSLVCIIVFDTKSGTWLLELIKHYKTAGDQVLYSMLIALLMHILELYLLNCIDRTIYMLTNNAIVSYITTFSFYIPGIIFGKMYIFPFGKGSAYQVLELFAANHELAIPVIITINVGLIWILSNISQNKNLIIRKEELLCQRS